MITYLCLLQPIHYNTAVDVSITVGLFNNIVDASHASAMIDYFRSIESPLVRLIRLRYEIVLGRITVNDV